MMKHLRRRFQLGPTVYEPASYWESRAEELIDTYDRPEQWDARKWMRSGVEEELVPRLLRHRQVRSVLVIGAGSGRQYEYLLPAVETVRGIDISRRLVAECQRRYPSVTTELDSVVGAEERHAPADAVIATAVLQHVRPSEIEAAIRSVQSLALDVVVLREATLLKRTSTYQWAYPYEHLFRDWSLICRTVTDQSPGVRVELLAFTPTLKP
jgi:SAM-dependent methyltransferase